MYEEMEKVRRELKVVKYETGRLEMQRGDGMEREGK